MRLSPKLSQILIKASEKYIERERANNEKQQKVSSQDESVPDASDNEQ